MTDHEHVLPPLLIFFVTVALMIVTLIHRDEIDDQQRDIEALQTAVTQRSEP